MYTLGIDVGSTTSKCVILRDGNIIVGSAIEQIGTGTKGPVRAIEKALAEAKLTRADITYTIATGYGRNSLDGVDGQLSELSCHSKGVANMYPDARTIIDIGGQDAKVIRLTPQGKMQKFLMNDKCAAGTGRFLSVMARVLDIDLSQFGALDEKSECRINISSTCTVFAESEVISHLANNVKTEDVIAAIHRSIADRVGGLVSRMGAEERVVMTGGVAADAGVVRALEREIGTSICVSSVAQLNGAYGAALYAYEKAVSE